MNSNRPSKPNLPSTPKLSKLLVPRGCAKPISFLAFWISLLDHSINQCKLVHSKLLSRTPNSLLTVMDMVRKSFGKIPLKDLTMERKKVKEFEESLM